MASSTPKIITASTISQAATRQPASTEDMGRLAVTHRLPLGSGCAATRAGTRLRRAAMGMTPLDANCDVAGSNRSAEASP